MQLHDKGGAPLRHDAWQDTLNSAPASGARTPALGCPLNPPMRSPLPNQRRPPIAAASSQGRYAPGRAFGGYAQGDGLSCKSNFHANRNGAREGVVDETRDRWRTEQVAVAEKPMRLICVPRRRASSVAVGFPKESRRHRPGIRRAHGP